MKTLTWLSGEAFSFFLVPSPLYAKMQNKQNDNKTAKIIKRQKCLTFCAKFTKSARWQRKNATHWTCQRGLQRVKKREENVTAGNKHCAASRWEWLNFLSSEIKVAPCPAAAWKRGSSALAWSYTSGEETRGGISLRMRPNQNTRCPHPWITTTMSPLTYEVHGWNFFPM